MTTSKVATIPMRVWFVERATPTDDPDLDEHDLEIAAVAIGPCAPVPFASLNEETRSSIVFALAFRNPADDAAAEMPRQLVSVDSPEPADAIDPVIAEVERGLG